MTIQLVSNEIKKCEARIKTLCALNETERDSAVRMKNIDEMIAVAKRMSKLDTLHKKLLLKQLKKDGKRARKRIKRLMKSLFYDD